MGNDWYEPRDKGPSIEEPRPRHKKKSRKKPFVLEHRYIGPVKTFFAKFYESQREWCVYQRYATEKARQQAFDSLEHKRKCSHNIFKFWEYRIP